MILFRKFIGIIVIFLISVLLTTIVTKCMRGKETTFLKELKNNIFIIFITGVSVGGFITMLWYIIK